MSDKINLNEIPNLLHFTVNGRFSDRVWDMRTDFEHENIQAWHSMWWCDDGDGVELYIEKDKSGFELSCFSGIPASKIIIDVVDYGTLWNKAFDDILDSHVQPIQNYSFVQQSIMLADWFCRLFCEWKDVSGYKQV